MASSSGAKFNSLLGDRGDYDTLEEYEDEMQGIGSDNSYEALQQLNMDGCDSSYLQILCRSSEDEVRAAIVEALDVS